MRILAVAIVVLVGCASVRQRAETAYSKGRYREAAELYDQLVKAHPGDTVALGRRLDARRAVLHEMLGNVQASRRAGVPAQAITGLAQLLAQRDTWEITVDPNTAPGLAIEVAAAANDIEAEVEQVAHAVGPLAGEARLADHAALLARADFHDRPRLIASRLQMVGRGSCEALAVETKPEEPHWSWLVDRYCAHWGASARVARGVLPDHRQALAVDGSIEGLGETEGEVVRDGLAAAFRHSAWYAKNGTGTAHATVTGKVAVTFSSRPVALSADWIEQVPYTDYVTTQESYQEPYDDTESYTEEVPYSDSETKTETCGETTCTSTVWVTKYRTEWKTRTVTKYRTAWRDVTTPVTKYRDVPHVFTYQAIEHSGHYTSALSIKLDTDGSVLADLLAAVDRDDRASGIEHDVTFAPANIHPERADLESREQLIAAEGERLRTRLVAVLDARYAANYCIASDYTRDTAAACAYLDLATAPDHVHATLRGTFGGDERFLAPVLARR